MANTWSVLNMRNGVPLLFAAPLSRRNRQSQPGPLRQATGVLLEVHAYLLVIVLET